jgi:hypothetical protein
VFETLVPENPLFDATGAKCAQGKDGSVWFLYGPPQEAIGERSCTITAGELLFFPVIDEENDAVCDPPPVPNQAALLNQSQMMLDGIPVQSLFASLDGVPFRSDEICETQPTQFSYVEPPGDNFHSFFGCSFSGSVSPAFAFGYWLMLAPLSPGKHVLTFGGTVSVGPPVVTTTMTYNLTVE